MKNLILLFFLTISTSLLSQDKIDKLLERYNNGSVPYISVETLKAKADNCLILDTRKKNEFLVSHIPGAIWVGEKPNLRQIDSIASEKDKDIVVYCSVGIRSEDFGEALQAKGYTEVKNLYGSIFAWKDAGYKVVDSLGQETEKVHVFGRMWRKYLKTGEKVY